jgi:hypothetical protein
VSAWSAESAHGERATGTRVVRALPFLVLDAFVFCVLRVMSVEAHLLGKLLVFDALLALELLLLALFVLGGLLARVLVGALLVLLKGLKHLVARH